jgi:hypothetical protein
MLSGTGFIFKFFSNQKHSVPVIVTNRHILKDILSVTFYFNSGDMNNKPVHGEPMQPTSQSSGKGNAWFSFSKERWISRLSGSNSFNDCYKHSVAINSHAEIHPFPSEVFHYGLLIRHKLYQSINWFVTIRPYTKLDLNLIGCTTLDIMTSTCIKT